MGRSITELLFSTSSVPIQYLQYLFSTFSTYSIPSVSDLPLAFILDLDKKMKNKPYRNRSPAYVDQRPKLHFMSIKRVEFFFKICKTRFETCKR